MHERINQIIDFLMDKIARRRDPIGISLEALSQQLLQKGYTEGEINKAVEWVIMNLNQDQVGGTVRGRGVPPPALRILVPEERHFFAEDAYGYLIQLQSLGIISPIHIEQVLERCFMMGLNRVELEDVKLVVTQVLLGRATTHTTPRGVYSAGNDILN